jgi:hypothetical protein
VPPQSRRPIRTDFRLPIDSPGAAPTPPPWTGVPGVGPAPTPPSGSAGPTSAVTRMLNAIWSSDGGGQGGRPLDEALTNLGDSYIENDRVVWDPPAELSPDYADYLSQSVAELNRLIETGVVEIDDDGNIRPTGA